jgi:hypothetical protein
LELGELTAPALLDSQCAAADAYVSEGAPANCDDNAVQAAMVEQDDGYLVLDDVDFGEVFIMLVSRVN